MKTFAHPRWEDFEYEYLHDNPFGWVGNGWTKNEKEKNVNVDYLDLDHIDFPAIPGKDQGGLGMDTTENTANAQFGHRIPGVVGNEHRTVDLSTAVTTNGVH